MTESTKGWRAEMPKVYIGERELDFVLPMHVLRLVTRTNAEIEARDKWIAKLECKRRMRLVKLLIERAGERLANDRGDINVRHRTSAWCLRIAERIKRMEE